ncbi:MAG TPA: hypothetical protein VMM59_07515, partial [Thermohalobaculum sp.]|nr:hypothetical protein [Thermohalobaculum sp.]
TSYTVLGADAAPLEIGVRLSAGALEGLPDAPNNTSRCFDMDGNGRINESGECLGDYQLTLPFADEVAGREDIPFLFAMVNLEANGHPPLPWSVPHFDIHFYSITPEEVEAIAVGSCDFFIDCAVRERALQPVPAAYVHAEFADVAATVGQMGNHLIDTKTPELAEGGPPFTHTWIYGAFEGRIIFHEVMATTEFLTATEDMCAEIKQPQAWERAGYYPTRYCFGREADGGVRIYMADFVMRPAG